MNVAFKLFCEKGYYKNTTNEIAKIANISIANLYFYFKDKDTIFFEILHRYNKSFIQIHEKFTKEIISYSLDRKAWLRKLLDSMIKVHECSRELNKEIYILSLSKLEVATIMGKQNNQIQETILNYFQEFKDEIKVKDIEAAAIVAFPCLMPLLIK